MTPAPTPDPLRAALREIADLPADRLDEAPENARRGLVRADHHGHCLCTECMDERFGQWVQRSASPGKSDP